MNEDLVSRFSWWLGFALLAIFIGSCAYTIYHDAHEASSSFVGEAPARTAGPSFFWYNKVVFTSGP